MSAPESCAAADSKPRLHGPIVLAVFSGRPHEEHDHDDCADQCRRAGEDEHCDIHAAKMMPAPWRVSRAAIVGDAAAQSRVGTSKSGKRELVYLPVWTNWMQSPWFLKDGCRNTTQPPFLQSSLLVGRNTAAANAFRYAVRLLAL
jgi:hypothetical protein